MDTSLKNLEEALPIPVAAGTAGRKKTSETEEDTLQLNAKTQPTNL
jgi:hypothetical protein